MRVLLIIKNFDFGGAENHVRELANSLADMGSSVHLIGGKGRQVSQLKNSVKYTCCRLQRGLLPFQLIFLCIYVVKHKIQVIHAHQRLPILFACLTGRIIGIPVIATVHGRTRFDLRSGISRNQPVKIIFVSRHVLEVSARYEDIKQRSVVIPNWVSVQEKGLNNLPYSICYVSRIDRKHSDLILLIIQTIYKLSHKYPSVTFRIIGEGEFLDKVYEEAALLNRKLNREACIVYGFVLEVKDIIWQSELVIGVGRVALEALANGVSVISMNRQRMGSIISRANYEAYKTANFVAVGNDPPEETSLLSLLDDFFGHRDIWKKEASELKESVLIDFDPEMITGKILEIYHEVSD